MRVIVEELLQSLGVALFEFFFLLSRDGADQMINLEASMSCVFSSSYPVVVDFLERG